MTPLPGFGGHLVAQSFLDARTLGQREAPPPSQVAALRAATLALRSLGPASAPRALLETFVRPLAAWLGFDACEAVRPCGTGLAATVRAIGRPISLIVTPWGERLDGHWRSAVTEARRCDASWALLVNGIQLRVVHAGRLYSRRFASFDLPLALEQPEVLAVFSDLVSAPAVCGDPSHPASLHAIVSASDRYAAGVCRSLRVGVLSAASDILGALIAGAPGGRGRGPRSELNEIFEQALTIVYRILFLLFAEARALVPLWHPVYRESYSIESLRDAVEQSSKAPGLWDALRAISRLAHAGCRAGDLRVTPFNGRLFAPARTPLAERRNLDAGAARRAVLALSTRPSIDRAGRERIVYRDLGVEQIGAVYETLLDYRPHVTRSLGETPSGPGGRGPRSDHVAAVTLERGGGVRKATGAFYTPQPIAEYVVQHTLAPLVRDAAPDEILRLRVLDPAMGSGAFLVAACRYLASAYEHAAVTVGGRRAGDVDDDERAAIRRLVAERCLYGVDLNPMAVQLARLSLWLATLSADRPLSFLDHRLVVGDSLIGTWLTHLRRPPVPQRGTRLRTLPLFPEDVATTALKDALPVRFSLEQTPNDTLDQVRAKERALEALAAGDAGISKWKRVANLWCAGWFGVSRKPGTAGKPGTPAPPGAFPALADGLLSGSPTLPARAAAVYLEHADAVSRAHRFFHWELEFPEVFFDGDGRRLDRPGFDAVIGNPPWDMLRVDRGSDPTDEAAADTIASTVRFTRDSGVYRAQSGGHANRYQLFFERVIDLTRPGGRFGLVLPSGLATDPGSAALRRELFARCDVDSLVGVDNRRGIFPIHRGLRFLLVSATAGSPTRLVTCRLGVESAADLEALPGEARGAAVIQLSPDTIRRISGPSLAIPYLRSAVDLAICEKAAALFPPLGSDRGWAAHFGRELNATDDRGVFQASRRGLPVIDGRHIGPFRASIGQSTRSILAADARRILGRERIGRPRLAYRDVASATNRLTLIAAVLPAGCVSTHTLFCLRTAVSAHDQQLLCGLFNSLVVNYLVRLRVTTHVTAAIVEQLPIPTREASPRLCREIADLAARLARGAVNEDKEDAEITPALAVLNARVAELYRLTRAELEHILATFPLVAREVRDAALAAFP
jgi:hypothetical protein